MFMTALIISSVFTVLTLILLGKEIGKNASAFDMGSTVVACMLHAFYAYCFWVVLYG